MERKVTPLFDAQIVDQDQGIVDHLFSVYGVVDEGGDRVHPGAFLKTTREGLGRIKVLDSHNNRSIMSVLGKPIEFYELPRERLPASLLERFPEATGGMVARVRYLLETPEGRGAFARIKAGAVTESSFGYDVIQKDYTEEKVGGELRRVRELRELRLYDISPVIFGMNPATAVLSVKGDGEKRWRIEPEGNVFCIYRLGEDGTPQGDPLKCYRSEGAARDYLRALYANLPEEDIEMEKAEWTTAYINDLPDSAFLYIEPGHEKDEEGKTVPRSARHFPVRNRQGELDEAHLRNAIARIPQSNAPGLDEEKKRELQERARRLLEELQAQKGLGELCEEIKALREAIEVLVGSLRPDKAVGAEPEPPQGRPPLTPEERIQRLVTLISEMIKWTNES